MSVIELPKVSENLVGRLLRLGVGQRSFVCGGFSVNVSRPYAHVTEGAQLAPIQHALMAGRLIDVTDQDVEGIKTRDGSLTAASEIADTGKKVFMGRNKEGFGFVIIPRDEAHAAALQAELDEKGYLEPDPELVCGMSQPDEVEIQVPIVPVTQILLTD